MKVLVKSFACGLCAMVLSPRCNAAGLDAQQKQSEPTAKALVESSIDAMGVSRRLAQ